MSVFHGICKGTKQSIGKKVDCAFCDEIGKGNVWELPTTAGAASVEATTTPKTAPIAGAATAETARGTAAPAATETAAHGAPEQGVAAQA
jgi:hypothetical protein